MNNSQKKSTRKRSKIPEYIMPFDKRVFYFGVFESQIVQRRVDASDKSVPQLHNHVRAPNSVFDQERMTCV
jgi:hypothetical protein